MKKIEEYVRSIPDFPEPGIIFRDITSVLQDADGLQLAIDSMQECLTGLDVDVSSEFRLHIIFINHLCRSARKENFHVKQYLQAMTWNTAVQRSRCIKIPSNQARRLPLSMI